jgi:DNA invertase Pin-like site-specific DNA recombinase
MPPSPCISLGCRNNAAAGPPFPRIGVAGSAAKVRGVYQGRKLTIDANEVRRLRHDELLGPAAIARRLDVGRASVYRMLGNK